MAQRKQIGNTRDDYDEGEQLMDGNEKVLRHLSDGYRNAQETIRALDVKTNILTALSVFCFTAMLGVMKVVWDHLCAHPETIPSRLGCASVLPAVLPALLGLVLAGSLFIGALCLWCCMATLMARGPAPDGSYVPATVLFPYIPPKKWGGDKETNTVAQAYYDRVRNGEFSEGDILAEYHNQISNVAGILGEKIAWNGRATNLFRWQVLTIPVTAVLIAIMKCF